MTAWKLTAAEIAAGVAAGKLCALQVTEACLARIAAHDGRVGSFLRVDAEGARRRAAEIDRRVAAGEKVGPLAGVPVALKDNLCQRGEPTTCASRALENFRPPYSATVVERLEAAGAVCLGKCNLDEFAMGSTTENSALGRTRNPWDLERVPGGSSGGSGAAVGAGFAPLALGSDTGGSIRVPAAFCGCAGFKPTYGAVSRWGLVAYGSSLDQIGPLARTCGDLALALNVIAGPDPRDSTCSDRPAPDFSAAVSRGVAGLKIGLPKEYYGVAGLAPEVREKTLAAVDGLRAAGAEVREISLPRLEYAIPTYYIIATAEASSNLARYDGVHYGHRTAAADNVIDLFSRSRRESFGPEVKRRILLGTYVLSAGYYDAYYLRALRVRSLIACDFARAFAEVDVIAGPVAPATAFRVGEKTADPLQMYLADIYTISANLAALPAMSVPCGADAAGLPVGLQLIADRFRDDRLLQAAAVVEQNSGWTNRCAPLDA